MNRLIAIALSVVLVVAIGWYLLGPKKKKDTGSKAPEAIVMIDKGGRMDEAISSLMVEYYALSTALVAGNTEKSADMSRGLADQLKKLPVSGMESNETLEAVVTEIRNELQAAADNLSTATAIDGQRKQFQLLSSKMFDLLRAVQYHNKPVYQVYCPMAFNNAGAAWLSEKPEIINPYFGDKMLHCGEIRDSIVQ